MRRARWSSARARRRAVAAGVLAVVGLVAGCTAEEPAEPEPAPSVGEEKSPTPSETLEPSPTETGPVKPERPAEMEQQDAEGAAAAAEYYLELYPYVMTTGDTSEWIAMSHEACESCTGFIEQARTIAERKDVFSGGVVAASVGDPGRYVRDDLTGLFPLDLSYSQDEMVIVSEAGDELYRAPAESAERRVEVGLRDGGWVIVTIAEVPQ